MKVELDDEIFEADIYTAREIRNNDIDYDVKIKISNYILLLKRV